MIKVLVNVLNVKMAIIKIKLKQINVCNILKMEMLNVKHGLKQLKMNVKIVHLKVLFLIRLMNVNKLQMLFQIVKFMLMNFHVKNVIKVIILIM